MPATLNHIVGGWKYRESQPRRADARSLRQEADLITTTSVRVFRCGHSDSVGCQAAATSIDRT
jgi:hypothetical protein